MGCCFSLVFSSNESDLFPMTISKYMYFIMSYMNKTHDESSDHTSPRRARHFPDCRYGKSVAMYDLNKITYCSVIKLETGAQSSRYGNIQLQSLLRHS